MTDLVTVYATFPELGVARQIGRAMVEGRLAACVNILPVMQSIYTWEGVVEEADEVAALFKTRADRVDDLIAAIVARHPYEVPALVVVPIDKAFAAFGDWIRTEVTPPAA